MAMGVRAAVRWAAAGLPFGDGTRDARREQALLRTSEDVTRTMGEMKGAAMKLGQVMSLMTGVVPDTLSQQLSTLHAQAPPMAYSLVEEVFLREFGRPPHRIFERFEREPFAAASIGQVHRARLPGGRDVAVKVQYPGVDEAIRADLANVGMMMGLATMVARGLDGAAIAADLREGIGDELDYLAEARNQQHFARLFAGHPAIVIPCVYEEYTTSRVLTQEYLEGQPFAVARDWSQERRDHLAEVVFRFAFGSIYRHGLFNGDPHPGNYLLLPGDRVGFVDFGCVARFEPETVEGFARIVRALVEGDLERWRAGCEDIGILHRNAPFETEDLYDHMKWFWAPILEPEVRMTRDLASEMVRRNSQTTGHGGEINKHCNVPRGMLFLTRINFGLAGLLGGLNASGPWQGVIREYVYGDDPVTELGRQGRAAADGGVSV